jgi:predicted aspartyl protease
MSRTTTAILVLAVTLAACTTTGPDKTASLPEPVVLYSVSARPDELGRIVVPVTLNGEGPFYFMLDTGATHTVIAQQALDKLGLMADPTRQVLLRGVSGAKPISTALVQNMQAGSMEFNQIRMPVLSAEILDGMDGVIGNNTIGQHRITADFLTDQIQIIDTQGAPADKSHLVVPFTPMSRAPIMVEAIVGGVRTRAIIDTGGADTLGNTALLKALRRAISGKVREIAPIGITDVTNTTQEAMLTTVTRLTLGPVQFDNLPVSFGDYSVFQRWGVNDRPTLLIGMDALGLLKGLVIDFQRKELHIPISAAPATGS